MNIVNIILLSYLILGAMSMVRKECPHIRLHLCPKVIILCQYLKVINLNSNALRYKIGQLCC